MNFTTTQRKSRAKNQDTNVIANIPVFFLFTIFMTNSVRLVFRMKVLMKAELEKMYRKGKEKS